MGIGDMRCDRSLPGSGRLLLVLALFAVASAPGCGKDDGPSRPAPTTAAGLTAQGWEAFAGGDYTAALAAFEQAIDLDAQHGPAHLGAGWARLAGGQATEDFEAAVMSFDTAAASGETGAEMLGGRAAARLALGGAALPAAVSDAAAALDAAPDFVFAQRPSFDAADLHLIVAFAEVARARYADAMAAADGVAPSGIDPSDPSTWVVGGQACSTYAQAALARLAQLSDSECTEEPAGGAR